MIQAIIRIFREKRDRTIEDNSKDTLYYNLLMNKLNMDTVKWYEQLVDE